MFGRPDRAAAVEPRRARSSGDEPATRGSRQPPHRSTNARARVGRGLDSSSSLVAACAASALVCRGGCANRIHRRAATRTATSCSSPSTRCGRMRCRAYGGRASTPHLDALAARGARFTFAHAHAVVTLPSHTSC